MNNKHIPNAETYRPWLGRSANTALFELVQKKNRDALDPLAVNEWLIKMIEHWWKNEFPDRPFPADTERYDKDFDFVQSA